MSIGTIDRTPPPFFRQGPSALTKLVLCSALALFLMVADNRFTITRQLRAAVATALYYPQQALLVPVDALSEWTRNNLMRIDMARAEFDRRCSGTCDGAEDASAEDQPS